MLLSILNIIPFILFSQNEIDKTDVLPNDVGWVTESFEYQYLCIQIYETAILEIRKQDITNNSPFIVMDLDETVLDNSNYQIELRLNDEIYNSDSWNKWVKKELANLVPGAKEFILEYKKNPKARIIYISNRDQKTLNATKSNMDKLGIPLKNDLFLLRKNKNDSKIIRRKEVLEGSGRMKDYGPQKIIAYFGDAIGDFPDNGQYRFGKNKFIFPNPMYGEWER